MAVEKKGIASENILGIVIGVKEYNDPKLHTLPAAENNANDFKKFVLLERKYKHTPDSVIGIPDENIFRRTDGAFNANILRNEIKGFIDRSIKKKDIELIIFYYSGHGAWDNDKNKYYLTVKETLDDNLSGTAMEISDVFSVLSESKKKVVAILDSCFSENAFNFITSFNDYYIIASSAYNKTSKYLLNEEFSVFTQVFIETIKTGIQGNEAFITFSEVLHEIKRKLIEKNLPEPKCSARNSGGDIIVNINNYVPPPPKPIGFNLEQALTRIYNALFPGRSVEDKHARILSSFPTVISVYLRELLSDFNKEEIPPDKKLIKDKDFLMVFYHQIISLITFMIIKDLRDNHAIRILPECKDLLNSLNSSKTTDNGMIGNNHSLKINIIQIACTKYREILFVQELKNERFLTRIETIEKVINDKNEWDFDRFRKLLFFLIEDLSFFRNYELLAVRFIEVKKSFYGTKLFKHEVSHLYGETPSSYLNSKYENWESINEFLNNAVILIPKIGPHELNKIINSTNYLNLWPFIVDGLSNQKDTQIPQLYMFEDIEESEGDKRYIYRQVEYKKEREESVCEYSALTVYPEEDELQTFVKEYRNV